MLLAALLILAFSPLDWTFPWWLWVFSVIPRIVLAATETGRNLYTNHGK